MFKFLIEIINTFLDIPITISILMQRLFNMPLPVLCYNDNYIINFDSSDGNSDFEGSHYGQQPINQQGTQPMNSGQQIPPANPQGTQGINQWPQPTGGQGIQGTNQWPQSPVNPQAGQPGNIPQWGQPTNPQQVNPPVNPQWGQGNNPQQWPSPINPQWNQPGNPQLPNPQVWPYPGNPQGSLSWPMQWANIGSQSTNQGVNSPVSPPRPWTPESSNEVPLPPCSREERWHWNRFYASRSNHMTIMGPDYWLHPDSNPSQFPSKEKVYDFTVAMYDNQKEEEREGSPGEAQYLASRYRAGLRAYRDWRYDSTNDPNNHYRSNSPNSPYDLRDDSPVRTANRDLVLDDRGERNNSNLNQSQDFPPMAYQAGHVPRYPNDHIGPPAERVPRPPVHWPFSSDSEPESDSEKPILKRKHDGNSDSDQEEPKLKHFKFNNNNGGNNNGEGSSSGGFGSGTNPSGGTSNSNKTMTELYSITNSKNKEESNSSLLDKLLIFLGSFAEIISSVMENIL